MEHRRDGDRSQPAVGSDEVLPLVPSPLSITSLGPALSNGMLSSKGKESCDRVADRLVLVFGLPSICARALLLDEPLPACLLMSSPALPLSLSVLLLPVEAIRKNALSRVFLPKRNWQHGFGLKIK